MKLSFGTVYNASIIGGLALIGAGLWQISHGLARTTVGALVLALTIYGAERLARLRGVGES